MVKMKAFFVDDRIVSNDPGAFTLYESRNFGEKQGGKIVYMLEEAFFLFSEKKLEVLVNAKVLDEDSFLRKCRRIKKDFLNQYLVFRDLRKKGYVVKTALKFGAQFRVYEKGAGSKVQHAKWLVIPIPSSERISWQDFCAKNRIANSTKKDLLIAIIDDEADISYYAVNWTRP